MMDCLFCKIVNKEIPVQVIIENEDFMAFNDINPKAPVHVLIITKKHYKDIAEIEEGGLSKLPAFIKELALELGVDERGYRIIANKGKDAGQVVFHVHFHLLAGKNLGDLL